MSNKHLQIKIHTILENAARVIIQYSLQKFVIAFNQKKIIVSTAVFPIYNKTNNNRHLAFISDKHYNSFVLLSFQISHLQYIFSPGAMNCV